MTGVKVTGLVWLASVTGFFTVSQINPADAGEKLMYGNAQVILGVCVLGLSGVLVWLAKRLMHSMEARVEEATKRGEQIKEVLESNQNVVEENTVALNANATSNEQLKDAVYHLSSVVDRKMDKT